ncbi:GPI mannosyltransferase 3 [Erysiphe neolycopersici]|uniref:GPI mannosyltransferase 3 n=1 Tax=Erysiphe neolycopersici TaxID=212602 RepID=A0A420H793_9PEZI|nr:GPI mannosyltransferase 3 [Erysiphe neolycopersici]
MNSPIQAKNPLVNKPKEKCSEPNTKSTFKLRPLITRQISNDDIWKFLVIFRCINAYFVQTFFQPDEFYQSLEPAWQMAFGTNSGAWITWARYLHSLGKTKTHKIRNGN